LLQFSQPLQEVAVTTAQQHIKALRKELAVTGADPYEVAAMALEQAERYRLQLEAALAKPSVVWMRPPAAVFCGQQPA
jgi:hypothetical protein